MVRSPVLSLTSTSTLSSSMTPAIEDSILSTGYVGTLKVSFQSSGPTITVRSPGFASNPWTGPILRPLVNLYGWAVDGSTGDWETCGAAYALKSTPTASGSDLCGASAEASSAKELKAHAEISSNGIEEPVAKENVTNGMREGEWLRLWESTIVHAVKTRQTGGGRISLRSADPKKRLDGYT